MMSRRKSINFEVYIFCYYGEIDTGCNSGEFMAFLLNSRDDELIIGHTRRELAEVFVKACEKDLYLAFVQNYDFWYGRYKAGFWDKETFEKRLGKYKGNPFRMLGGQSEWEELTDLCRQA
jgi:hypothetical protein